MNNTTALTNPRHAAAFLHYEYDKLNRRWRYTVRTDEGILKWLDYRDHAIHWLEIHFSHNYYIHDTAVN